MLRMISIIVRITQVFVGVLSFIYCFPSFSSDALNNRKVSQQHKRQLSASKAPYQPTIAAAQYALHQGDARFANLVEGFIPFSYHNPLTIGFINLRYYNPNSTPVEYNGDIGFRHLYHHKQKLLGLYGGFDRYRSETSRYFSQVHGGVEYWVKRLFFGGNIYIPVGTKVYDYNALNQAYLVPTSTTYRYNIAYEAGKERVLPGMDIEMGYDITHGLTTYLGGYYFDHSDVKHIAGPKARATYTFYHQPNHRLLGLFDRIRFEGLISYDSVRRTSWYVGLRASIALSKTGNPTIGVIRHMVDPVRRDLNVVSSGGYKEPSQLYQIDGHVAQVDIVDGSNGRTINDAVDGAGTLSSADIIGVRGSQPASKVLMAGYRNLTVTGGAYSFILNGHSYTIPIVGSDGQLTSTVAGTNLWNLAGEYPLVLGYLTMNTDSAHFLLRNGNTGGATSSGGGDSFNLTMDHIIGNAPVDLTLSSAFPNATGHLLFYKNQVIVDGSTAENQNISPHSLAAVALICQAADQKLLVQSLIGNNVQTLNTPGSGVAYAWYTSDVMINGNMSDNISIVYSSSFGFVGYGWFMNHTMIAGNVSSNTFAANHMQAGFAWATANSTIIGDVRGNDFNVSYNYTAPSYAWRIDIGSITGDISDNVFNVNNNVSFGYGWSIFSVGDSTTIGGEVARNVMNIEDNNINSEPIHIEVTLSNSVTFKKTIRNNALTINGNNSGEYGFNYLVNGNLYFQDNTESNLKWLNNNATASSNTGTGTIHYNG